jgi:hypothetical protein
MEYTDAYRHAATLKTRAEVVAKRDHLLQRIASQSESTPYLNAAMRGYDDYLFFGDEHPAIWEGR